jgi:hypothetical protein
MPPKYFELNGLKLKLEFYKLYYWCDIMGNRKLKKPYWKEKKITKNNGYLLTSINYKKYYFHRIIYYAYNPKWDINFINDNTIDHIDRNKLNNNIFNLRVATRKEQADNRDYCISAKGYTYNKRDKRYQTQIRLNNKEIHLGCYDTEQEAYNKYKKVKLFINVLKNVIYKH